MKAFKLQKKGRIYTCSAVVVAVAACYFLLTFNRVMNLSDEGYLLNNIQKVAEGQLPHRDFYDDYGPASYWIGGALFKVFGSKIMVIRFFLVFLRTSMALLIFLIGRRILSPAFALLGSLLFTLNWGDPLFSAFNVLYAGHFTHFLALLGLLFILEYSDTGRKPWLFGVSICVGLSILFKLPIAVIDFIGFALFLCLKEQITEPDPREAEFSASCPGVRWLQFLRALKCLGIGGVIVFYLFYLAWPHLDFFYFFLFLFPLFLFLAHMFFQEFSDLQGVSEKTRVQNWRQLKLLYTEMAVLMSMPILLTVSVALLYWKLNGLPELIYDTFVLPSILKFHYVIPDRRILAALTGGLVFLVLLAIGVGRRLEGKRETFRVLYAVIVSLTLLILLGTAVIGGISYRMWHRMITHVLLPATLIIGAYLVVRKWPLKSGTGAIPGRFLDIGVVVIFACQISLMIFIRSDETHMAVNNTVVFVVAAYLLQELCEAWRRFLPERKPVTALIPIGVWMAIASIPFLWSMKILYVPTVPKNSDFPAAKEQFKFYPVLRLDSPRARGLELPVWRYFAPPLNQPMFVDMNETVTFIREHTRPDEKIFLVCGDQMIYFLSERDSTYQKENYIVYLSNIEFIDETNTGKFNDEGMNQILASSPPRLIIQTPRYADTIHFTLTWPKTYQFIKNNYEVVSKKGEYQILKPRYSPAFLR